MRLLSLIVASALAFGSSSVATAGEDESASPVSVDAAVERGVELLIGMQEGEPPAEWPYEGVYRVRGEIPIGYRVGGTSIVGLALVQAPGYRADEARREAVARAVDFVVASIDHPLMDPDYEGGYDVRGWGHCYGLTFLLRLRELELVTPDTADDVERAVRFYLRALHEIEIPEEGGWSYSRARGSGPSPPSPFMTAPCLLALFEARDQGYEVDAELVERGLAALERGRLLSGSVAYSVRHGARDQVPGAVGRMLATETTLALAGRGTPDRVRGALDGFLAHWRWLEARRAKKGTHAQPYGVAPYYFYYAHYFAALAIELLPEHERKEYRTRLGELLFQTRADEGHWNDRVFERSANYGTAMALLSLMMPQLGAPAAWSTRPARAKEARAR